MLRTGRLLVGAGAAGAVAAARYQRRVLSALRSAADADEDVDLRFPGTTTHRVPTPDGGHLHVQECGAGPTVLLLHGHGSNLGIFGLLAVHLQSAGRRVVAMDQRGFGRSSPVPPTFAFDGLVDDVATLLGWLDLRDAVVVGHSMGGAVALGLAIAHPEVVRQRVAAVVLVNSTSKGPADGRVMRARVQVLDSAFVERIGRHPSRGVVLARANFGADARWNHVVAAHAAGLDSPVARRRGFTRRLLGVDLTDGLRQIDVPVVALAGGLDRVLPVAESARVVEAVPGATLRVFAEAGHMLPLERAAEVAAEIVRLGISPGVDGAATRPSVGSPR